MRSNSNTNRINRKKKILECFLSIHKSLGNVLIQNPLDDKLSKRYEFLYQKVRANKNKQFLKNKNYLKEKRLNQIFYKNDLYKSQKNEETKKMSHKSEFEEKYNELYNITTSINNNSKRRVKSNSTSYLSNRLKKMNNYYDFIEASKGEKFNNKNFSVQKKCNNIQSEIFKIKNDYQNGNINNYLNNISVKNSNRNSNNCIRKKFYNKIDDIKSSLSSIEKSKSRTKNNAIINNFINSQDIKRENKIFSKKNEYIYKSFKSNSFAPINLFFRNCNNLKKSTFTTNNLNLFGQEDEERIIDKVNYFKVRLNLLSMK